MRIREWEKLLLLATEKVWTKLSPLAKRPGRGRGMGIGASGDETIYADMLAEDVLLGFLKKMQGVRILSEEAGEVGDPNAETLAVIDPLDGSSNFKRGIPFYCSSVAVVADGSDDVTLGVVRDLVSGDVYVGRKGGGAWKNGRPIATSRTESPSEAIVGVDLSGITPALLNELAPLIGGVRRQVHLGANALELCYLAEGRIDAFVDVRGKIRITDFAAGRLIALEAGAIMTGPDGSRLRPWFDLRHRFGFVASANLTIHEKILELCRGSARPGMARS